MTPLIVGLWLSAAPCAPFFRPPMRADWRASSVFRRADEQWFVVASSAHESNGRRLFAGKGPVLLERAILGFGMGLGAEETFGFELDGRLMKLGYAGGINRNAPPWLRSETGQEVLVRAVLLDSMRFSCLDQPWW